MILPQRLKKQWIKELSTLPEVKRAILFGSRAIGDADERSDIDLAIEAPQATQRQWLDIWFLLVEESDTLLPVEVIRLEEAPEELRKQILAEGEVLYERP